MKSTKPTGSLLTSTADSPRRQVKAASYVVESLRREILSGTIPKGTRLPNERQLAKDFELSQPTIREAIRVLESMSLIEVRHGSGTYVTGDFQGFISRSLQTMLEVEGTKASISDIIELRSELALYSIKRVIQKATDSNLRLLEKLEQDLSDASSGDNYRLTVDIAMAYQAGLSAATHNPLLFALEFFLIELMMACQLVEWSEQPIKFEKAWPNYQSMLSKERRKLMDALKARNEKKALSAMKKYLHDQVKLLDALVFAEFDISNPELFNRMGNSDVLIMGYREFHNMSSDY